MSSNDLIPAGQKGGPERRTGLSTGAKLSIAVIVILLTGIAIAFLTLTVTTTSTVGVTAFPYTTRYTVSFPEGQQMAIGNTRIVVLSFNNEMVADVDGNREKLVVGEDRIFAPRHTRVTVLGIPLLDSDFQILMKYKGVQNNRAYFDLTIKTEKQVPEYLLNRVLPAAMEARAIQP